MFLTFEEDKIFCNTLCEARFEYGKDRPSFKVGRKVAINCAVCGLPSRSTYCSHACKAVGHRVPEEEKQSKKRKGKPFDFELANKKEERRRVFDDKFATNYVRWGGLRDRV